MVTTLSSVFRSVTQQPVGIINRNLPMINVISSSLSNFLSARNQIQKKKHLMTWFKITAELKALSTKVAKDIVQKYHFEPVSPSESGRNKVMNANKFALEVGLRRVMFSQAIDLLITGEAYGWMGKIEDKQLKTKIKKHLEEIPFLQLKEKNSLSDRIFKEVKQNEGLASIDAIDEDLLRPRKYRYVASTTVETIHDQFDIISYKQTVGTDMSSFSPKDIIRYTFEDIDGKIMGFTPVESVVVQLELLRLMWQNMLALSKNGGAPDKLFILENSQPNSPAYKRIEQQLQKYKVVENKHGNMLFTGKITVEDLQQLDQMQFKDMGLYITGLIAMQWGIPRSSIPFIVGGTNTKEDTGGNSSRGYWRNVAYMQSVFAEIMNVQLWIPHFGVQIVFDNPNIQEDVQLHTAQNLKLINIQTTESLLRASGKKLSKTKRLRLLGLTLQDVEEMEEEELQPLNGLPTQPDNDLVNNTDDKQNLNNAKRQEQADTIASQGMKPTGVGKEIKEFDLEAQIEYKQMIGGETQIVPLPEFIHLYNEDRAFSPGMSPRVFMTENSDFTTFKFKSSDFIYKVIITNSALEQNQILLMNLQGNIHKI